jgi:type IV pilus assembly protein PilE
MREQSNGFTLVEILIVLAIISIIAVMAYPSYVSYFYKSNRLDAMISLFHYQGLLQQCRLNTFDSDDCLNQIGIIPNGILSLQQHYQIEEAVQENITLVAIPLNQQAEDLLCMQFLLDDTGHQQAFDHEGNDTTHQCW